jgi:serine/threonine-protein kinase
MDETALIHPHTDTSPAPMAPVASARGGLPLDLQEDAVRRLRVTMLAVMGGLLFAVTVKSIMSAVGLERPEMFTRAHQLGMLVSFVLSLAMYRVTRSQRIPPQTILNIGIAYVLTSGLVIALMYCMLSFLSYEMIRGTSWLVVWVVLFPLVVPSTPARTLFVSLATASMMPLALWLTVLFGNPAPSSEQVVQIVLPTYVAATIALVPALIISKMNRDVVQARRMGSYHLDDLLGRGGMGEVWRASHRMLKRPAAVKLIRPESLGHDDAQGIRDTQKRFAREAQVTASLNSPHTVELYDFGRTNDGTFYYVMELLDGVDLQTLVERFGPLPAERVAHILRQTCDSLADAHHVGLVHRDVKPANIFVCRRGLHVDFVKVLDFGLVKATRMDNEDTLRTAANVVSGTPAYLPPEVAQGATLDARADLYSLGCVAFWLLSGQTVFSGKGAMQLALQHVQEQPIPPSKRCELEIPEALENVVMQCLEKEPHRRPASAADLDELLAATGLAPAWTPQRAERWWRRHRPERPAESAEPSGSAAPAVS